MLYTLTFKKAFGLKTIPVECMGWMLGFIYSKPLKFTIGTTDFAFSLGSLGESTQEKIILSYAFPSYERNLDTICAIPTINISLNVDLDIDDTVNDGLYGEGILNHSKADIIIKPYISLALEAVNRVIDAHRYAQYNIKRTSPEFKRGELSIIKEITLTEFKTYLYYTLENNSQTLVGGYGGGGKMTSVSSIDSIAIMNEMRNMVKK